MVWSVADQPAVIGHDASVAVLLGLSKVETPVCPIQNRHELHV